VARVPDNLPLEHAAGLPLVALTAWQALQQAKPQAGQRVVINAASGGVGHVAVQVRAVLAGWLTAGGVIMWQPASCLHASFLAPSPPSQHPLSTPSSPSHTTAPTCVCAAGQGAQPVCRRHRWPQERGLGEVSGG
jgi:hypothetical protein